MDRTEQFLDLFLEAQAEVKAFVLSMVRDRQTAEDVMQEVALVLWQEFGRYDPAGSFVAWARGIAGKKILQSWARTRRGQVVFSTETIQAVVAGYAASEPAVGGPEIEALETCLEQLSGKSRKLIELRYRKSLTLDELAGLIDSSLGAVHMALMRIRSRLQQCIESRLATGSGEV